MAGKLVICPTPLGNLDDMPPRALDALRAADAVCAEDTRVTGKLLAAFSIAAHLERLDEEMIGSRTQAVIDRVAAGQTIVYCSDAGMPGVSDPGQRLVAAARAAEVPVEVLPGPTAVATAYVASGFTCPRFYFGGFFPRKAAEREACLEALGALDAVLVFYESPHRIADALAAVAQCLPQRDAAVCRELTKVHEEIFCASVQQAAEEFARRDASGGVKGEIVLVIDAPGQREREAKLGSALDAAAEKVERLRADATLTNKDRVRLLQDEFGISRNDAYRLVHGQ